MGTRRKGSDHAYLIISVILSIGALGVLLRRSPLIVLLLLEYLMLNGANLSLIAFFAPLGNGDGQIFAMAVMAASRSVGLGLPSRCRGASSRPTWTSRRSCAGDVVAAG